MLNLLKSITGLFSKKNRLQPVDIDTGYNLSEAIDQIIDGIDPKLRLVPHYLEILEPSVSASLRYIGTLVDQIPGPIDISRNTFITDPEVRAYFATPDTLEDIFGCGTEIKTFFELQEDISSDTCCALLCANKREIHTMGLELKGEMIHRDVPQTSISFFDYKILSPALDDVEVRNGIKKCIFDGLVTYALQHIASIRIERDDLTNRHRILHSRLRSRMENGSGLTRMLAEAQNESVPLSELEDEIKQTETRLKTMTGDKDVLTFYLDEIKKVLDKIEDFIHLDVACFRLNDMGIIVDNDDSHSTNVVCFSELEIINVMKRVVTIVRYNKNEINCNRQLA